MVGTRKTDRLGTSYLQVSHSQLAALAAEAAAVEESREEAASGEEEEEETNDVNVEEEEPIVEPPINRYGSNRYGIDNPCPFGDDDSLDLAAFPQSDEEEEEDELQQDNLGTGGYDNSTYQQPAPTQGTFDVAQSLIYLNNNANANLSLDLDNWGLPLNPTDPTYAVQQPQPQQQPQQVFQQAPLPQAQQETKLEDVLALQLNEHGINDDFDLDQHELDLIENCQRGGNTKEYMRKMNQLEDRFFETI